MSTPRDTPPGPADVARDAYRAAEAFINRLGALEEAETEDPGSVPDDAWPDTAGAYCGCGVCDLREGLFAAWPVFLDGAAAVLAAHGHAQAATVLREQLTITPMHLRAAA